MKLRLYLDTSVISAYFDVRAQDRLLQTRLFWETIDLYEVHTSSLVCQELERTADAVRRREMLNLLNQTLQLEVSDAAEALAGEYVRQGLFGELMYADALHLAIAVTSRQDAVISWNFRHLVNRRKRAQVLQVNALLGLPTIEVISPPEL